MTLGKRLGFFSGSLKREEVYRSLNAYLDKHFKSLALNIPVLEDSAFWEQLEWLLESQDTMLRFWTLEWMTDRLKDTKDPLPETLQQRFLYRISQLNGSVVMSHLLDCLNPPPAGFKKKLPMILAQLEYSRSEDTLHVIEELFKRYLDIRNYHWVQKPILRALKQLDAKKGQVTDLVLHHFPSQSEDHNRLMIHLLGQSGKYRVIKPLIAFSQEFPQYLRAVSKAFSHFEFDEVDQFYLDCLKKPQKENPIILLEAIKQIRRRRLKKAIELLDLLFPLDESQYPLISRKINGEIALTMASFGSYIWARDRLLPEIMLSGINLDYLRAIDMLGLQEAVPLMKAILLMPETPATIHLQEQTFQICQRLLSQ